MGFSSLFTPFTQSIHLPLSTRLLRAPCAKCRRSFNFLAQVDDADGKEMLVWMEGREGGGNEAKDDHKLLATVVHRRTTHSACCSPLTGENGLVSGVPLPSLSAPAFPFFPPFLAASDSSRFPSARWRQGCVARKPLGCG